MAKFGPERAEYPRVGALAKEALEKCPAGPESMRSLNIASASRFGDGPSG